MVRLEILTDRFVTVKTYSNDHNTHHSETKQDQNFEIHCCLTPWTLKKGRYRSDESVEHRENKSAVFDYLPVWVNVARYSSSSPLSTFSSCCTTTWMISLVRTPQLGAADAEIKVVSGENTELKGSLFKAWSRSVRSHTCYTYCQGVLPCLFLPFQTIHLHFF